jgi:hypothetical protein
MTAEQRPCLACGTEFTWTGASPRKRFCSQQCRLAWHGEQRRGKPRPRRRARHAPPAASSEHHAATNDVPRTAANDVPHADTVLAATRPARTAASPSPSSPGSSRQRHTSRHHHGTTRHAATRRNGE